MNKRFRANIQGLPTAYFAMVMATGIVSIASDLQGHRLLAVVLLWANTAFYLTLWCLFLLRVLLFPGNVIADLGDHDQGPGYFTMVAGTCILGSQFTVLTHRMEIGAVLFFVGAGLWVLFIYGVFAALAIRSGKPSLENGVTGGWLIATVSTQSLAVLGAAVSSQFPEHHEVFLFVSLCLFGVGSVLYIMIITLIFHRFMFFRLTPRELTPQYFVNMGAVAITALAGTTLAAHSAESKFLEFMLPFTWGVTVCSWAVATWWIPFLFVMGLWRHWVRRVPFSYTPRYWSMVFPLGMYTVCSVRLADMTKQAFLLIIPDFFIYVAWFAWALTFLGLLRSLIRSLSSESQGPKPVLEAE
jgi:tellurite resistance protein TehA-like permease